MMFSYVAYGLGMRSTLPLPELMTGDAPEAVKVRFGRIDPPRSGVRVNGWRYKATQKEIYLFWEGEGAYLVRGGSEIIVDPDAGVDQGALRLSILGPVLGVLFQQRGMLTIHASGVAVQDGAVLFMGNSGGGKSTLAAAMYARGHGIIADDVVPINNGGQIYRVFPGFPQLKLWPQALTYMGEVPDAWPRVSPQEEKRSYRVDRGFPRLPLPLRCIYLIADGAMAEVETLPPPKALIELVRHSYLFQLLHPLYAETNLLRCADLAKRIPIRRLTIPKALPELPNVVRMVEKDIPKAY